MRACASCAHIGLPLTPDCSLSPGTKNSRRCHFSARLGRCGLSSNHRETSWWPISSAPDSHVFVSLRRRWRTPCRWTSGARSCADASGRRVPTLLALTLPLNLTLNLTFTLTLTLADFLLLLRCRTRCGRCRNSARSRGELTRREHSVGRRYNRRSACAYQRGG